MSQEELQKIVERALNDEAFRKLLTENPKEACAGFDVTEEEIQSLADQFSGTSEELEARISKRKLTSKFGGLSGPMGIEDAID